MSDGSMFRAYVCNICLPEVAMHHAQLASRRDHPFCPSLVDYHQNRLSRRDRGRGIIGDRGRARGRGVRDDCS